MRFDLPFFLAGVAAGALLGGLYLVLLWASVRRLVRNGFGDGALWGLTALRWGLFAGAVVAIVQLPVPAVLGGMLGFLFTRTAGTRLARRGTSPPPAAGDPASGRGGA
jgi:hypothetical protein